MRTQTYNETLNSLNSTLDKVVSEQKPVLVKGGEVDVVILPLNQYETMQETLHLLSSANNANRLRESIKQI